MIVDSSSGGGGYVAEGSRSFDDLTSLPTDTAKLLRQIQGFAVTLEADDDDAIFWMTQLLPGHPRAQDFEPSGHGGSDPTATNGLLPDSARDDARAYRGHIKRAWKELAKALDVSKRYRTAVRPERQANDVADIWCVLHLQADATYPRYRGELCRPCVERRTFLNKHGLGELTLEQVRHHANPSNNGRWPKQRIDPKQPKREYIAGLANLQAGAATLTERTS